MLYYQKVVNLPFFVTFPFSRSQNPLSITLSLLRIANPQILNRLGHFLTTDCKSVETPNGR